MNQDIVMTFWKTNEKLESAMGDLTEIYCKIAEDASALIKQTYGTKNVELPINIELVARELGITVSKRNLNLDAEGRFSRILGKIVMRNQKTMIEVDNNVSYKTRRYAMAHAVGRYLLSGGKNMFESTYAIPLIPQGLEEIMADVVALFLLLPVDVFKVEFAKYLEECMDYPLDVDAWLQYLSDTSQISLFNLSIGYQQLKQVLGYQRQKEFAKSDFNIYQLLGDPYNIIYA